MTKKSKKVGRPKNKQPMADRLTLDVLQSLTPFHHEEGSPPAPPKDSRQNYTAPNTADTEPEVEGDVVTKAARDLLVNCLQNESKVRDVFFPNAPSPSGLKMLEFRGFPLEELAVMFMAEAIMKTKDQFGFHKTIERSALEEGLRDIYKSLHWKKLGFQLYTLLYPDVVKDPSSGLKLRDFMGDDAHVWAEQLVHQVTQPLFTRRWQARLVRCQSTEQQYNEEMNALFVKLHLLDPQSVIPAYQYLLNQRALPAVNLELATRNYLGGPLDYRVAQPAIEEAERRPSTPVHVSRLSLTSEVDVYHGVDVEEFIVTEGRQLGLWNGTRPDNCRQVKAKDKCCIM